jgi:hypothetical protein
MTWIWHLVLSLSHTFSYVISLRSLPYAACLMPRLFYSRHSLFGTISSKGQDRINLKSSYQQCHIKPDNEWKTASRRRKFLNSRTNFSRLGKDDAARTTESTSLNESRTLSRLDKALLMSRSGSLSCLRLNRKKNERVNEVTLSRLRSISHSRLNKGCSQADKEALSRFRVNRVKDDELRAMEERPRVNKPRGKGSRLNKAWARPNWRVLSRHRPNRSILGRLRPNWNPGCEGLGRLRPKEACVAKVRVEEEGLSRDRANWRPEGPLRRANELRPKMNRQGVKPYAFES